MAGIAVQMLNLDWHDSARDRTVPVRIYCPASAASPAPVIVFSHGVGGSRIDYAYLGQYWAARGYVSVHLEHPGSNAAIWQGTTDTIAALRGAVLEPANTVNRARDVQFAIDQLGVLNREPGPLQSRLDLERIGAAGHSFGAATALVAAGQTAVGADGREHSLADPRIRAAVVLSPSAPRETEDLPRRFAAVRTAMLHITGTNDESPIGLTSAAERRTAYDHIGGADQFLVVFRDVDHMTFGNLKRGATARHRQAAIHSLVQTVTTAFWDAYLNDDRATGSPLAEWIAQTLADRATVEWKAGKHD